MVTQRSGSQLFLSPLLSNDGAGVCDLGYKENRLVREKNGPKAKVREKHSESLGGRGRGDGGLSHTSCTKWTHLPYNKQRTNCVSQRTDSNKLEVKFFLRKLTKGKHISSTQ